MSLVNIFPILIVLSMIKIIYSHKFMMEKVFNVKVYCQNAYNYKFTSSKRDIY